MKRVGRPARQARSGLAWALFGFTVLASATTLLAFPPLSIAGTGLPTDVARLLAVFAGVPFAFVGALIVASRPQHRMGWLLLAFSVVGAVMQLTSGYRRASEASASGLPGGAAAGLVSDVAYGSVIALLVLVIALFPTGRLPSPRWRPLVWAAAVLPLSAMVAAALPGREAIMAFAFAVATAALIAAVVCVFARMTRARGDERQQVKWFAYSAFVCLVLALLGLAGLALGPGWPWSAAILNASLFAIPAGIGFAILRHRLYDIDVLIGRTLVYGATSAALLATYVASVLALGSVARPLTGSGELAVAGSTLAVIALFQPLRSGIQRAVDRRFYRRRYDAQRTVDVLSMRLRDEVELDAVRAALVGSVLDTVRPTHASVWLRPAAPGPERPAGTAPTR